MTNVPVPCLCEKINHNQVSKKLFRFLKELWYDYNDVKQAENTYSQLVTLIQGVTDNPTRETESNR